VKFYIILATNSMSLAQVFGTPTGQPFMSESRAEEAKRRLERQHPSIDFLVLPISDLPVTQNVTRLPVEV